MPPIPFADNFLAGSLLTILLPLVLLISIVVWYLVAIRHVPEDTPASSASLPSQEVIAAATDTPAEETPPPGPQGSGS